MPRTQPQPQFVDGIRPMLVEERPFDLTAPGWVYEIKYDGYRCLAEFGGGAAFLRSKAGGDIAQWFPEITRVLADVPGGPHVVDGEIAVLDDIGRSDFDRLQARAVRRGYVAGSDSVAYCAFDVLVLDGTSVMNRRLIDRKAMLAPLLDGCAGVLPVSHFGSDGRALFERAVIPLALEGLVAKRAESLYRPGIRSPDWVKVKRKGAVPPERFKRR